MFFLKNKNDTSVQTPVLIKRDAAITPGGIKDVACNQKKNNYLKLNLKK